MGTTCVYCCQQSCVDVGRWVIYCMHSSLLVLKTQMNHFQEKQLTVHKQFAWAVDMTGYRPIIVSCCLFVDAVLLDVENLKFHMK